MEVKAIKNDDDEDISPIEKDSRKKGEPHEEVEEIPFEQGKGNRNFRIGTKLGEEHKRRLIALIIEYMDVFVWGPEDIPGIDPNVAVHKLYIDPTFQRIKQKKQLFNDEKNKAIREEVQTLFKANAICELKFPNWIASVVFVNKPNNKWRKFTHFTSLNKACPTDFYPLPCLG
ncbi:hypothetical protein LIER_29466 [Lithospermum erythrorhizon]|uniref:Uncharacterized protein n=1 Tax=Lithospermum erythrorhizon TaxID=34254 RepID=A0AAV3RJQ4_LITER